jgi:hypothetical protein
MGLKYAGDAVLVYSATGRIWTPLDYVVAMLFATTPRLATAPTWLLWAMVVWVLPFIFLGVRLTMRRAMDAGWTPWAALGFFVPFLNYGLMFTLCWIPSAPEGPYTGATEGTGRSVAALPALLMAVVAGAAVGLLMIVISVFTLRSYGAALFLGTPYVVATLSAYLRVRLDPDASREAATGASFLALGTVGAVAVLVAMEGAICVAMAVPLAVPLGFFGASTGWGISQSRESRIRPIGLGLLALPLAALLEPAPGAQPVAREVLTVIEIAAAPEAVWPHVIAFRPMPEPTDWLSRWGIAYPKSARIAGTGVGAVRYCEFSTGAFVEPITSWEPGRRLAFDVSESPPPLRELSPYANLYAPHLDGFLRSRRGEFRLIPLPGGRTRLEGRTWYELDMAPEGYWRMIADWMIHRIHLRVLTHINSQLTTRN